jgi:hypothetical protein
MVLEVNSNTLAIETKITENDAIVAHVIDKPITEKVIEQKHVEVHHKRVVQEIIEQPIVEIEKIPKTKHIRNKTEKNMVYEGPPVHELIHEPMTEEETKNIDMARGMIENNIVVKYRVVPKKTSTIQDKEELRQIVEQPIIEPHIQPVITEVHRKKIIVINEYPKIRKVVHKPLVRIVYRD